MMGSGGTNEKGKAPAAAHPQIEANNDYAKTVSPNIQAARSVNFWEGNFDGGHFDSIEDMPLSNAGWEDIHQSFAQGVPETSGNPMHFITNPISFQNPQVNLNSNTANTNPQEVPLLPDWNMRWSPQRMNQGQNPTIARNFGVESNFDTFNKPQVNKDTADSSFMFRPRDTLPVQTRNNVNFNTSQCGVQGKVESNFLSLGIGSTEEAISDKLKEAASAELRMARARRAMGQVSGQTLCAGFMGFQGNSSGFSNQFSHVDRMTSTNNEIGNNCTLNSGAGSSPYHISPIQQNDSSRNIKYSDLDHYRAFVGNQSVHPGTIGGNSGQFLNSQQHSLNNLAPESAKPSWVASHTPSGQLQNIRYKAVNTLPTECSMSSPSIGFENFATKQNYAGQPIPQNAMHTQVLGGNLFSQRTATPQLSWVGSGPASIDAPFPKRLGVEFNGRTTTQVAQRHPSLMGTNLQATSTGQISQFPDKASIRLPGHVVQPSIAQSDRADGAPFSYPLNNQEPFFAHDQSQDATIQLPKDPQGAAPANASIDRPYRKRTANVPHSASHWIQRQRITTHPSTIHHPIPNTPSTIRANPPITTTGVIHRTIPQTQNVGHVAGPVGAVIRPSVPCVSHVRPQVPVTRPVGAVVRPVPSVSHVRPQVPVTTVAPTAAHITRKDPATMPPKLTGYKCLLCKRDLALTSEGAVYQPAVPPPVAVLPCGHTFHDQCLQNITPQDQAKDPPCIPCAIGEN